MKKQASLFFTLAATLIFAYLAISSVYDRQPSLGHIFNEIYAKGEWGKDVSGKGTSGAGSTLEITREYRAYIEEFIKKHGGKVGN